MHNTADSTLRYDDDALRQHAKSLAAEHAGLQRATNPRLADAAAWRARWREAAAQFERSPGHAAAADDLRRVMWLSEQYLSNRDELFEARWRDGDVRAGVGDVLAAVAAVAVQVEDAAGPRAAQRFLGWYHEFANEHHPVSLAHFFVAYHALVRGHAAIAMQHLEQAKPRLVLVGGGPGTGKSTLAMAAAEVAGWPVLSASESGDNSYEVVIAQAEQLLHRGEAVIIDAAWSRNADRAVARAAAKAASASMVELVCHLKPSIARERLAWQMASIWDPSDESPDLVDAMAAQFEPWPEAHRIDTALPLLRCRSDAMKAILGFTLERLEEAHTLVDEHHVDDRGDHIGDRHVLR